VRGLLQRDMVANVEKRREYIKPEGNQRVLDVSPGAIDYEK
jgi:hypothetical protein